MMMGIFIIILISFVLGGLLVGMNYIFGENKMLISKLLPFECGMENNLKTRYSFSIHFFLITIVFIFFDMEILILFNFFLFLSSSSISFLFCMFFIIFTLLYEWVLDFIKWQY